MKIVSFILIDPQKIYYLENNLILENLKIRIDKECERTLEVLSNVLEKNDNLKVNNMLNDFRINFL